MKRLSDLLPQSMPNSFGSYLKIKNAWADCAGDTIAFLTTPGSLKDGVLNVAVHDQTWVSEIGFLKGEITARLQQSGLAVENINFYYRQRPLAEKDRPAAPRKQMTEREKSFADRLVNTIPDENMRNSFRTAIYSYFTIYTLDDYLNC